MAEAALAQPLRLWGRLVAARVRGEWQYRTSFVLFALSQALITALELAALLILVELVDDLGGWSRPQVVFLYAMTGVPFALADVFVSSVERCATYVQSGEFDRILLRPTPAILQLSAFEFELRRIGKLVPAVGAFVWAMTAVDVEWTAGRIAYLALTIVTGTTIYGALWVLTSAFSFWAVASQEAANSFTYGGQFANEYPLHLYPRWIRSILGWALPLAFVAYVPSLHLLDAPNPLDLPDALAFTTLPVAIVVAAASLFVWGRGIRHYQSTGS